MGPDSHATLFSLSSPDANRITAIAPFSVAASAALGRSAKVKTLLVVLCLLGVGCEHTQRRILLISSAEVPGVYRAPLMLTWSHGFELRSDGTARYDVAYDHFFYDDQADTFVHGRYFDGRWVLVAPSDIDIVFVADDGTRSIYRLRAEVEEGTVGLRQLAPKASDGSEFFFAKEPNSESSVSQQPTQDSG